MEVYDLFPGKVEHYYWKWGLQLTPAGSCTPKYGLFFSIVEEEFTTLPRRVVLRRPPVGLIHGLWKTRGISNLYDKYIWHLILFNWLFKVYCVKQGPNTRTKPSKNPQFLTRYPEYIPELNLLARFVNAGSLNWYFLRVF